MSFDSLLSPMRIDYIHFLHQIIMMGILPSKKLGIFRKTPVHVGDPDVFFPTPSTIPKLMEQFCDSFPTILPTTVKYDAIKKAAESSYKFVRIHPYTDGNGRVSRLIMNLILWGHFPPVYLKADKKGKHRYSQALKRANRGNVEPLACLIAISLKEIYKKLTDAINVV
jgi:Fic family protein